MLRIFTFLLSAGCALAALPTSAQAMRCGTHLINRGDTRLELVARCGQPTDVARRVEESTLGGSDGHGFAARTLTVVVESWDYNFGPSRLMRRVELRDGIISAIQTLGQGYAPSAVGGADRPLQLGDSPSRVRSRWGEPADRSLRAEATLVGHRDAHDAVPAQAAPSVSHRATHRGATVSASRVSVEVQTWTYNFGPTRLMRRLTFRDGRLVRVETLGVGF
jgi:hypothetical protein